MVSESVTVEKVGPRLTASIWALLCLLAKLLSAVVEHSTLPVTAAMVVLRRVDDLSPESAYRQPIVEDALALSPFFFGIACLEKMRKQRPQQPTWGAGIYPLCL
jgi:hypothetical protein